MKQTVTFLLVVLVVGLAAIGVYSLAKDDPQPSPPASSANLIPETPGTPDEELGSVIRYTDDGFESREITVTAGTSVSFINNSSSPLWVASDEHPQHEDLPEFDAKESIGEGETYTFTFMRTGRWGFHNHLSPADTGLVIVE